MTLKNGNASITEWTRKNSLNLIYDKRVKAQENMSSECHPLADGFYPNLLNENDSNKMSIDFKWTDGSDSKFSCKTHHHRLALTW